MVDRLNKQYPDTKGSIFHVKKVIVEDFKSIWVFIN